ncbi:MAG: thermonuclease family protein [Caldilineaceae bacterium]|nr:thermonuclease family protein [Caldilineaceae bacterium]
MPESDDRRAAAQADATAKELKKRLSPWQWGVILILAGILAAGFGVDIFRLPELQDLLPITTPVSSVPSGVPEGGIQAKLVRVVDGDTIEVTIGGQELTVRYVGMDTPERGEPGYKAAAAANTQFLGEGNLWLLPDHTDKDRYGRLLRFIYTAEGVFVNREMLVQGWAQPLEFKPDVTRAVEFRKLASEAAQAKRGFWSGDSPVDGAMPYALVTKATPLRVGPGRDFETDQSLLPGLTLTVYAKDDSGRWLQVRTPDRAGGWVSAAAVDLNVALGDVPKGE